MERSAKAKKKKKKDSGRDSRHSGSKTLASGADSPSEGNRRKTRSKSRADTEKKVANDFNSKSCSSSTQDISSSSWRTSSSDGRSTSSSGENFGATNCTNSASSNEARSRQNAVNTGTLTVASSSSLTRINESLRWDFTECDDSDEEEERLKIYKLHRRKRYMDFLHKRTGGEPQSSFYA